MRLMSCHIDGFGKLIDFDFSFQSGLNQIKEENGWGKSTLAAFIKVMLYGFDSVRGNEINNEKKRYLPWGNTDAYGGSLRLSWKGREYVIERSFSVKRTKKDSFEVYDAITNLPCDVFSEKPGEDIFGIDSESFQRTIFIGQNDVTTSSTSGIQAKIGKIKDQMEDLGNYENTDKKLHDLLNSLSPDRKTGKISKLSAELSSYYGKEAEKDEVESELFEKGNQLYALKIEREGREKDLKAVYEKINEAVRKKDIEIILEEKKVIEAKKQMLCEELLSKDKQFPKAVPEQDELERHLALAEKIEKLKEMEGMNALESEEKERREKLSRQFLNGAPKDEEVSELQRRIASYKEIRYSKEKSALSADETEKLRRLHERFHETIPEEAVFEEMKALCGDISARKRDNEVLKEKLLLAETKAREATKQRILSLILGAVCLAGAFGLYALNLLSAGIFALLGLTLLGYGLLIKTGRKEAEGHRETVSGNERKIAANEKVIREFLASLKEGYQEETAPTVLYLLKDEANLYKQLQGRNADIQTVLEREQELEKQVKKRFYDFGKEVEAGDDFALALRDLVFEKKEFEGLLEKEDRLLAIKKEMQSLETKLSSFLMTYGFERGSSLKKQFIDLIYVLKERRLIKDKIEAVERETEAFYEKNKEIDFLNFSKEDVEDLTELNKERETLSVWTDELNIRVKELSGEILAKEELLNGINEMLSEKLKKEAEKKELEYQYQQLKKTKEFLKEAKDNFLSKYRNPIKESFDRFYKLLAEDEKLYELDAKLDLKLKEGGERKDIALLSTGYRDLVGFCRRLSMVLAMYEEEKPFIIMDDPFVNLDEMKMARGRKLINEIAKEYQILYFYCHESRKAL